MAEDFSKIVSNLLDRIPYLKVFVSTLLPRFDAADKLMMSNPNNVRKVMNVEISSLLSDNKRVVFINNDIVLEWWKDEVKKNRLFSSDGHMLTAYGFSVMLDHWMTTLKDVVTKENLTKTYSNVSHVVQCEEPVTPALPPTTAVTPPTQSNEGEAELKPKPTTVALDQLPEDEPSLADLNISEVKNAKVNLKFC